VRGGSMHWIRAALLWSGGKDSALALHHVRAVAGSGDPATTSNGDSATPPGVRVVKLVTCVSQAYDRVSMHGVRRRLIQDQADALGLPVDFVVMPPQDDPTCPMAHSRLGTAFPSNDVYTRTILAAWERLKAEGIEAIVFGDIF